MTVYLSQILFDCNAQLAIFCINLVIPEDDLNTLASRKQCRVRDHPETINSLQNIFLGRASDKALYDIPPRAAKLTEKVTIL